MSPARRGARGRPAPRVDIAREGAAGGISDARIRDAVRSVIRAERARVDAISLTLVSDARMRGLNRRHLGRNRPTDVIAFSLPSAGAITGDIYVAPDAARRSAAAHGVTVREELLRLVVHGVLHALGHDHPEGEGRTRSAMWRRQERLVRRLARASR